MTEVLKKKRRKSCPFTKEDELRLVKAIYAHKKIIENKETNKVTNAEKVNFNTNTIVRSRTSDGFFVGKGLGAGWSGL